MQTTSRPPIWSNQLASAGYNLMPSQTMLLMYHWRSLLSPIPTLHCQQIPYLCHLLHLTNILFEFSFGSNQDHQRHQCLHMDLLLGSCLALQPLPSLLFRNLLRPCWPVKSLTRLQHGCRNQGPTIMSQLALKINNRPHLSMDQAIFSWVIVKICQFIQFFPFGFPLHFTHTLP